jgi:predicted MPP superfamily phosphohydrolase
MSKADLIKKDIKDLADKLKRVPEKHEYLTSGKFKEWELRKVFGGWAASLSASGALKYDDPEVKSLADLRVRLSEHKDEIKRLNKHISDIEDEAVSSKTLRDTVHGVSQAHLNRKVEWLKPKILDAETSGVPVLFLSDLHLDEVVCAEQIQNLNKYNRQIAVERLHHTVNTAITLLTEHVKNPRYPGIVLALGGDIFSGNIHEELAETNEDSINRSIVFWIGHFIGVIDRLLSRFKKVFIPAVVGNHGRHHKKPRAKNKVYDNYEWVLYQFLARHYRDNQNVAFMIPDGADAQFQIYSKTILLTHGDQFRGGNGISGIFSPLMLGMSRKQKRNASVRRPFDLMMVGHFHQLIMTESLIINGSMKGYDEYAFISNFMFERPKQALFIVNQAGEITHQMPIFCDGFEMEASTPEQAIKLIW